MVCNMSLSSFGQNKNCVWRFAFIKIKSYMYSAYYQFSEGEIYFIDKLDSSHDSDATFLKKPSFNCCIMATHRGGRKHNKCHTFETVQWNIVSKKGNSIEWWL